MSIPSAKHLTQWLQEPEVPERWLIDGLIREKSRNTLVAEFKAGKTKLILNLIRSVVDGDPFLGELAVTPLTPGETVVLLDFEMSANQLKKWIRIQAIQNTDLVVVCALRGRDDDFRILDDNNRSWWANELKGYNCKFLILDCLGPALNALGLSEDIRDIAAFGRTFDKLLRDAGVEYCIVVHHMGHGDTARPRGGSNLRGWVDAEILLYRRGNITTGTRSLSASGRDVELEKRDLEYDEVTERFTFAPPSLTGPLCSMAARRLTAVDKALQEIVVLLQPPSPPRGAAWLTTELKKLHKIHLQTVRRALKQGVSDGQLKKSGPANDPEYEVL